jgi:ectoine hydroxylase-related dioxygenase (phytanoyl-CoA dioxygenase family)
VDAVLSQQQVETFQTQGFLAVPGFFTGMEVRAMQGEIQRFLTEKLLRNVATAGDGTTPSSEQRNLQLCPTYQHSRLFRALPFHSKVRAAVSALIGDPLVLQLDQVFLKPARDGMGTNWHQDNAYFKVSDPTKGTAMWVAIHDASVANGTMHVQSGAFRDALPHYRDPMSDHHIRCDVPEEAAVPIELAAGGVLFFYYGTPHCTRGNVTERDRAAVAFHFCRADFAPAELLDAQRTYHPYLTGPQATGGAREYGESVSDSWELEVQRALQHYS